MGIKKRLCNPIAEKVAEAGDPEVHGAFIGAGRAASAIEDLDLRRDFEARVVVCEEGYIAARKSLATKTKNEMDVIFKGLLRVVERQGGQSGRAKREPKTLPREET